MKDWIHLACVTVIDSDFVTLILCKRIISANTLQTLTTDQAAAVE